LNIAKQVAELKVLNDEQKVAAFEYMWRGTARHYSLTGEDRVAFEAWAETKISSIPYFIHGLTTSQTESLHSLNNKYAMKGKIRSFLLYTMRKNIALLHWNELKRARARAKLGSTDDLDEWDEAPAPIALTFRRNIALSVIRSVKS